MQALEDGRGHRGHHNEVREEAGIYLLEIYGGQERKESGIWGLGGVRTLEGLNLGALEPDCLAPKPAGRLEPVIF